ncbi:MAG: serine/threonine protein kinase [Opitutae bacterium]|jgi:serine/threonine-protein kinase|nr:serine/threonine protein kinase [Opitutae bacterium]
MKHIFNEVHYELTRKIAEGGMGLVYEATQKGIGGFRKVVAIKLIREEYSAIEEFRNNFIGEAKLVSDLIHTNIVQTYHLGKIGEQYFMTMEFVTGWNLEEFLDRHVETDQYIPADLAVFIVSRICRGLGYAHRKKDSKGRLLGIVHRDVNPKNIMIAQEGDVKLTDFGIAKALDIMYNKEGDVIAGKDEYLSPEQARCEVTDHRADLFCCGIVMSELLLSRNIFEAYESEDTIHNILEMEIPDFIEIRADIDPRLNKILQTSLQRQREKRYQSSEEMLTELESFIYGEGYGPTNEKLAAYSYDLFGEDGENAALRWHRGETQFADH